MPRSIKNCYLQCLHRFAFVQQVNDMRKANANPIITTNY